MLLKAGGLVLSVRVCPSTTKIPDIVLVGFSLVCAQALVPLVEADPPS